MKAFRAMADEEGIVPPKSTAAILEAANRNVGGEEQLRQYFNAQQGEQRGTFVWSMKNLYRLVTKIDSAFEREGWKRFEDYVMSSYDKDKLGKYLADNPLGTIIDDEDEKIEIETYVAQKTYRDAPLPFNLYVEFDTRLKNYLGIFSQEVLQLKLFNSTFLSTLKYYCRAHVSIQGNGVQRVSINYGSGKFEVWGPE